jgi:DNA (cytosine-5)-methyltransferase 1
MALQQSIDSRLRELALFAGAGGGILGGKLLGWRTACAVEWDAYARDVLVSRQNDGSLDPFPIWDDVLTFDGRPWRGAVDVVSGGFPCQDISTAGKGAGINGARSGMWAHMARIIGEVRPRFAFVENSPAITHRGLGRVLGDLAAMGYDARWCVLGAHHAGAPHKRDRIWIVADASGERQPRPWEHVESVNPATGCARETDQPVHAGQVGADWWLAEPNVGRVAHGVANRVDRLRCLGNGQVPAVAALAWRTLT